MAPVDMFGVNPGEIDNALRQLDVMRPAMQSCSADSARHHNWASNLITDLIHHVAADLGGLHNAVEDVWNRVDQTVRNHDELVDILIAGFTGGIPQLYDQDLQALRTHLNSGRDRLSHVIGSLWNPLTFEGEILGGLSDAAWFLGEAHNVAQDLTQQLDTLKAHVERLISLGQEDVGRGAQIVTVHASEIAGYAANTAKDIRSSIGLFNALQRIDAGPPSLRDLGIDGTLQSIADLASGDFNIMRSWATAFTEDLGMSGLAKSGRVGLAAMVLATIPAIIGATGHVEAAYNSGLGLAVDPNSALGRGFMNISRAWNALGNDADTVGAGVDELTHAFLDMHGLTILEVGGAVVAAGALTVLTGGADLALLPALAPEFLTIASAGVAAESPAIMNTFQYETIMGANPANAPRDFSNAGHDFSAAPKLLPDTLNLEKLTIEQQGLEQHAALSAGSNPTRGAMENAAHAFAQRSSR